jgi:hypothetical protein
MNLKFVASFGFALLAAEFTQASTLMPGLGSIIAQDDQGRIGSYFVDSSITMEDSFVSANLGSGPLSLGSTFDISLTFDGTVSPARQATFNAAAALWEGLLPNYKTGVTGPASVVISATLPAGDGPGGILGSAGPTTTINSGGFTLANTGQMEFDSFDVADLETAGTFDEVILHEMGHVLGIGTLWNQGLNALYVNGSGQYTGADALAAFQTEWVGQGAATFVPVELGGGAGTANGHWNESDGGGAATGLVRVGTGEDMQFELMTGWLDTAQPNFISQMTLGSLSDMGFFAVPEPSTGLLGVFGVLLLGLRRRR